MATSLVCLESFRNFPSSEDSRSDSSKNCLVCFSFGTVRSNFHFYLVFMFMNQLPRVDIRAEKINPLTLPKHAAALAFIQNENTSFSKKLLVTWKTQGTQRVLELLSQTHFGSETVNKLTKALFTAWNSFHVLHGFTPFAQSSVVSTNT